MLNNLAKQPKTAYSQADSGTLTISFSHWSLRVACEHCRVSKAIDLSFPPGLKLIHNCTSMSCFSSRPHVSYSVVQQAAETYSGYQGLLGLQADEFANLTAAEKEAEGRYAVWKTLLELQEKVIDWTTGPLLSRQDNSVSLYCLIPGRLEQQL